MKAKIILFTLSFILGNIIMVACFGQLPSKKEVTPNPIQIEKLNEAYKQKFDAEIKIKDLTELIIGYKLEEVDSLRIENGLFKFALKPKKK